MAGIRGCADAVLLLLVAARPEQLAPLAADRCIVTKSPSHSLFSAFCFWMRCCRVCVE
jgi:hypothetical protein